MKMIRKYGLLFLCFLLSFIIPVTVNISFPPVTAEAIPTQFYLTPWEGIRGSIIRIKGSTFTKSTVVKFYFSSDFGTTTDSIDDKITAYKFLGYTQTDSNGVIDWEKQPSSLQAVYVVPFKLDDGPKKKNTPGGACYIYATYNSSKNVIAFAQFTVTSLATMSITPETGFVGVSVNITGINFAANENTTAKLDDQDIVIKNGNRTTSGGEFNGTVVIPDCSDGRHIMYITDETGNVANATFTTLSKLTLNTTSQAFGGKITVTGTGFSARKSVAVSINGRELAPDEAPITTSAFGRFQATVLVPFDFTFVKGGRAVVSASVGTAAASAELDITTTSPQLAFTPELDSSHPAYVGMKLGIAGMWFKAGDRVNMSVDDSGVSLGSVVVDENSFFSVEIVLPPGKSGPHRLNAAGAFAAATREYIMESQAPSVPVTKSPRITGTSGDAPLLDWVPVNDPSGVTYELQVAADKDFAALLVDKRNLGGAEYIFTPDESARLHRGGAACYWRVRAVDGASNLSDWTPPSSFYIGFSWMGVPPWMMYTAAGAGLLILVGMYFYYKKRSAVISGSGSLN
jgi:hypothetical protein